MRLPFQVNIEFDYLNIFFKILPPNLLSSVNLKNKAS